jgi:hypothetical protein
LKQVETALNQEQVRQEHVRDNARKVEELDYAKARHEEQREQAIEDAREDAHEAIDKHPPSQHEFNTTVKELSKKFDTDISSMIGHSYNDLLQQEDSLVRIVHNLNAEYLKSSENNLELFSKYKQDLDDRLGGLNAGTRNNNLSQNSSGEQEQPKSA